MDVSVNRWFSCKFRCGIIYQTMLTERRRASRKPRETTLGMEHMRTWKIYNTSSSFSITSRQITQTVTESPSVRQFSMSALDNRSSTRFNTS